MVQKIVEIFTDTFMNNMEPSLGDSQPATSESSDDGSQLGQNPQEEEWEDWEEQEDEIDRVICLCSNDECGSVEEALALDVEKNGFDLEQFRNKFSLSFYDTIRLINFIRSERSKGRDPRSSLESLDVVSGPFPWEDDAYLVPVLENDAMMLFDWSEAPNERGLEGLGGEERLDLIQEQVQGLDLNDPAILELIASASAQGQRGVDSNHKVDDDHVDTKHIAEAIDDDYFTSYSFFDIHKEMLEDAVRTDCYRRALEENFGLIKGAKVLDVGCGTGVLSMFASRGGAVRVVGVDGSPAIANVAKQLCEHNGFHGQNGLGKVSIISSKIEELQSLPFDDGKADVIVSEWMGYALLFESMLDSVLVARDRFLRPGGAILPDIANIYVALGSFESEGLSFWNDIYGLSMRPIAETIRSHQLKATQVRVVEADSLLSKPAKLHSLDLVTMKRSDQDFSADFVLKADSCNCECSCIVLWFDTEFSDRFCAASPQVLSTSPHSKATHWAQTVLPLKQALRMTNIPGEEDTPVGLMGRISMSRQQKFHRTLDISLECAPIYSNGTVGPTCTHIYSIGVNEKSNSAS